MAPNPTIQRRQAHRRRKALGRALHQIETVRGAYQEQAALSIRHGVKPLKMRFPRMLRAHFGAMTAALFRA